MMIYRLTSIRVPSRTDEMLKEDSLIVRNKIARQDHLPRRDDLESQPAGQRNPFCQHDLVSRGAEGLLLIGRDRLPETRAYLDRRKVPYVLTWCRSDEPGDIFVGFDNHEPARDLTCRVLALGHRNIAMISGVTTHNDRSRDRQAGLRDAITAQTGARLVGLIEADYDPHKGAEACRQIMSGPVPPTAIICGNDVLASGAILAARQMGIAVPDQVSIIGFDDIELAELAYPALTTVRVPQIQMGHRAAELLLQMVEGKAGIESELLQTEFIARDSLAPPPPARP